MGMKIAVNNTVYWLDYEEWLALKEFYYGKRYRRRQADGSVPAK